MGFSETVNAIIENLPLEKKNSIIFSNPNEVSHNCMVSERFLLTNSRLCLLIARLNSFYLTIRLRARNVYEVINKGEARVNYRFIQIESE